jgi:hypothetical protein
VPLGLYRIRTSLTARVDCYRYRAGSIPLQPEGRDWRHQSVGNLTCASRAKMAQQGERPRELLGSNRTQVLQRRPKAPNSVSSKPGTALFELAPIFTSFLWFSFQIG